MKLQLGIDIITSYLTSPKSWRMIWWLFNAVGGIYVLVAASGFSRQMQLGILKSDFGPQYRYDVFWYFLSKRHLHILKGIVSDILFIIYDQVLAGSWGKFSSSNQIEDILVGQLLTTDFFFYPERSPFLYMLLLCIL